MNRYLLLIFSLTITFCSINSETPNTSEDIIFSDDVLPNESTVSTTKQPSIESTVSTTTQPTIPLHMQTSSNYAEIFFMSDIPEKVQQNFSNAFQRVQNKWGIYLSVVWVVGLDEQAMIDFAETYCEFKDKNEELWYQNFKDKDDCISKKLRTDNTWDFPYYRDFGVNNTYSNSMRKGHNGWIEVGYHEFAWSYPVGFENNYDEDGFDGEYAGIAHEYFHGVQLAHMDIESAYKNMQPTWFTEGSATFMAQVYKQELHVQGVLVSPRTLEEEMYGRYYSGEKDKENCPDKTLGQLSVENTATADLCMRVVYDWGMWAIAYLSHLANDPYITLNTYYPSLKNTKSHEVTFYEVFGLSMSDFENQFESWIKLSESERNVVIPKINPETGLAYYP